MDFEVVDNYVLKVEQVTTDVQTATVKTFYDMIYHIELATDKQTITADGTDTATISAQVYDYLNTKVTDQNPVITFTLNGVTVDVQSVNGQASTTITASTTGTLTISASAPEYRSGEVNVNAQ